MNKDRGIVKALDMCPGCIHPEEICVTMPCLPDFADKNHDFN